MKTLTDHKEELVAMALVWDGARGVARELKRRRDVLRCPDQSRGDDVTPGTSPCWGQGLADENDFCDTCKENRLAHQEYTLAKLKERSFAAKLERRIHRVRIAEALIRADVCGIRQSILKGFRPIPLSYFQNGGYLAPGQTAKDAISTVPIESLLARIDSDRATIAGLLAACEDLSDRLTYVLEADEHGTDLCDADEGFQTRRCENDGCLLHAVKNAAFAIAKAKESR